jgi:hypothetical protein
MKYLRKRPLACALGIYFVLFSLESWLSLLQTGGHLVYPLDDIYISMAMAKNFATHGVWGVTPFQFSSATSTPFYVFLLAVVDWFAGAAQWWPISLAFVFGALSILVASRLLPKRPTVQWCGLLALVLLTPLHPMAQTGMEHTLQILFTIAFALRASIAITEAWRTDWMLILIAPCLVMTRFEGLFLVGICALLLLLRRSFTLMALLSAGAAVPVVAYGAVSLSKGWFFLPNSLLLKGTKLSSNILVSALRIGFHVSYVLHRAPYLIGIVIALGAMIYATRTAGTWNRERLLLWISSCVIALHITFADVGWVFRYEAYLIALSVVAIGAAWVLVPNNYSGHAARAIVGIAAVVLLARSVSIFREMPAIATSIYLQQYQMARFVSRYYQSGSLAANDIGFIDYMTDVHLVDLVGLADNEVLQRKTLGTYTTDAIAGEVSKRGVQVAIVYDDWFSRHPASVFGGPPLPSSWIRVERWRIQSGGYVGGDTVSFYAVRPEQQRYLTASLEAFSAALPAHVTVLQN